jgi:hypothetical protein
VNDPDEAPSGLFIGCALIMPVIIQTILPDPSGPVWTDEAPKVSRLDPPGAVRSDVEHPSRNRKVVVYENSRRWVATHQRLSNGSTKPQTRSPQDCPVGSRIEAAPAASAAR